MLPNEIQLPLMKRLKSFPRRFAPRFARGLMSAAAVMLFSLDDAGAVGATNVADTYVATSGKDAKTVFGAKPTLSVKSGQRAYVQFELDTLPDRHNGGGDQKSDAATLHQQGEEWRSTRYQVGRRWSGRL